MKTLITAILETDFGQTENMLQVRPPSRVINMVQIYPKLP